MLRHSDFDSHSSTTHDVKLPEKVDAISVSHDGGRLEIYINGALCYNALVGTRDCNISIDRREYNETL